MPRGRRARRATLLAGILATQTLGLTVGATEPPPAAGVQYLESIEEGESAAPTADAVDAQASVLDRGARFFRGEHEVESRLALSQLRQYRANRLDA